MPKSPTRAAPWLGELVADIVAGGGQPVGGRGLRVVAAIAAIERPGLDEGGHQRDAEAAREVVVAQPGVAQGVGAGALAQRANRRARRTHLRQKIGDTITDDTRPTSDPLPGFQEMKPMVFAGLYPTDNAQYEDLRDALEKLQLNDSSFYYEPDTSGAPWVSAFAAASWAFCTWRSFRSDWNANSIFADHHGARRALPGHHQKGRGLEIHNPSKIPARRRISIRSKNR